MHASYLMVRSKLYISNICDKIVMIFVSLTGFFNGIILYISALVGLINRTMQTTAVFLPCIHEIVTQGQQIVFELSEFSN